MPVGVAVRIWMEWASPSMYTAKAGWPLAAVEIMRRVPGRAGH
ncbi:hypothetical protein ACWFPY_31060 [Nocardia fluminea]